MCSNTSNTYLCCPQAGAVWSIGSTYTIEWNAAHPDFQNTSFIDILAYNATSLIKNISGIPLMQQTLQVTIDKSWLNTRSLTVAPLTDSIPLSISSLVKRGGPNDSYRPLNKTVETVVIIVSIFTGLALVYVLLTCYEKRKVRARKRTGGGALESSVANRNYNVEMNYIPPPVYDCPPAHHHKHHQHDEGSYGGGHNHHQHDGGSYGGGHNHHGNDYSGNHSGGYSGGHSGGHSSSDHGGGYSGGGDSGGGGGGDSGGGGGGGGGD